jgi:hypothetical protein
MGCRVEVGLLRTERDLFGGAFDAATIVEVNYAVR